MGVLSGVLRSSLRPAQHRRRAVHAAARLSAALLLASAATLAGATVDSALPAALRAIAPTLQAAGAGRLTWFGIRAYDARLWVEPGFAHSLYAQARFALELSYLRAFKGADIARRSIEEMRRAGPLAEGDARQWQLELQRILPDVQPGDRILGAHLPGRGAVFLVNGKHAGEITDPRFAERFFGIWLAPTTSEPALRDALLANTRP